MIRSTAYKSYLGSVFFFTIPTHINPVYKLLRILLPISHSLTYLRCLQNGIWQTDFQPTQSVESQSKLAATHKRDKSDPLFRLPQNIIKSKLSVVTLSESFPCRYYILNRHLGSSISASLVPSNDFWVWGAQNVAIRRIWLSFISLSGIVFLDDRHNYNTFLEPKKRPDAFSGREYKYKSPWPLGGWISPFSADANADIWLAGCFSLEMETLASDQVGLRAKFVKGIVFRQLDTQVAEFTSNVYKMYIIGFVQV